MRAQAGASDIAVRSKASAAREKEVRVRAVAEPIQKWGRTRTAAPSHTVLQKARWSGARLVFYAYIGFCMVTLGIGGFATIPVISWYLFGDWRFWRNGTAVVRLLPHSYRMLFFILLGQNGGFMLGVPLTSPPHSTAIRDLVELQPTWEFGSSCGPCTRCCSKLRCPVLDEERGLCRGYDSFFWRYFNCGRFPTAQSEVEYYLCNKWQFKPRAESEPMAQPGLAATPEEMVA
jgi:hypothetical protein